MKNYKLYTDRIVFQNHSNQNTEVFFASDSGTIHFRYKINTISGVRHPGIYLGYDSVGRRFYMHNHYSHGRPVIESEIGFAKGQEIFANERQSTFDMLTIITRGLNEIALEKPYDKLTYNCQNFVNKVCFNENKSEAVQKWTTGVSLGILLLFGFRSIR